jgi:hypothetical protein
VSLPMIGQGAHPRVCRAVLTARGLARAGALAGAVGLAGLSGVAAQEATPEMGMMAGECRPAAATEMIAAEATPAADAVAEMGAATPASAEIAGRAQAAVENFVACWNAGDLGATLGLVTPNLLQTSFGVADAMAAEAALPELGLGPITLQEVGDVSVYDDGRASIDVGYQRGDFQHVDARWFMVERDGQLLIDQEQLLPIDVEGDKAFVSFSVADDASPVVLDQSTEVAAIPVLVLQAINNGAERHVFFVYPAAGDGATPAAGGGAGAIGVVSVAPGEREEIALADLPAGAYDIVDPAVDGSTVTLTVTEPSA